MRACIIAINSGHDRIMAFASEHRNNDIALKCSSIPVIDRNKNILVGVTNNEKLLTDLNISPIILGMDMGPYDAVNVIRNTIPKGYTDNPGILILTSNNFIYHWTVTSINFFSEYDEGYIAIGPGHEVAMGALYGLSSSRFTPQEQAEMAIKAVCKFYPELGKNTGTFRL